MVTPPTTPPLPPSGFPLDGGIPLRERVHHDLMTIQLTAAELQNSMASHGGNQGALLEKLQGPIEDLAQLTRQRPQVLSQNEIDVINTMQMQYQLVQMESAAVTPSAVAAIQGSASTIEQMFAAEAAKSPEPNSSALQALNYLISLCETIQAMLSSRSHSFSEIIALIDNMRNPIADLLDIAQRVFNPQQMEAFEDVKSFFEGLIDTNQTGKEPTLDVVSQFLSKLQGLKELLLSH